MKRKVLNREAGASLVEMVVVMTIIFVTAAAAVALTLDYLPTYRLRSGVWQLMAHLRLAQMRATSTSLEYRLNFKTTQTYQIERGNRFTLSDAWVAEDPDNPTLLVVNDLTFPDNVRFSAVPAPIVFRTNGTNRGDNTINISLKNEKNKVMTLSVSPTGRVKAN